MASLARPGGNLTGLTFLLSDLAAKRSRSCCGRIR
jgi:hypothetical protein